MVPCYHWLHQSQYITPLSVACKMCAKGSKMVVLITGKCPAHCFYCPLSKRKQNKDVIFADEWQLTNEKDVDILIKEAHFIKATGAGITGGDPLMVPYRTIRYISLLKKTFGKHFHIHLYTSGLKNTEYISDMINAGLDEIRFHPESIFWSSMEKSPLQRVIDETRKLNVNIALEIPVLPNKEKDIINLIHWADLHKMDYINLNELEFSEQNEETLYEKGYTIKNELSAAAKGSQETAYDILSYFVKQNVSIGIHYCSSSFKDGVQLTNRMKRRAKNIGTKHDQITDEGTILKGIIEPSKKQTLMQIQEILQHKLNLKQSDYVINIEKKRIELHPYLLLKHKRFLTAKPLNSFIIEEYPTADHLEVERIPIKKNS